MRNSSLYWMLIFILIIISSLFLWSWRVGIYVKTRKETSDGTITTICRITHWNWGMFTHFLTTLKKEKQYVIIVLGSEKKNKKPYNTHTCYWDQFVWNIPLHNWFIGKFEDTEIVSRSRISKDRHIESNTAKSERQGNLPTPEGKISIEVCPRPIKLTVTILQI